MSEGNGHKGNGKAKKKVNPVKAKKLVKALIKNNGVQADAARELGMTQQNIYDQIKNNPLVREGLDEYLKALEKAGATDKKSARVVSEAMDAEKTVSVEDFTDDEEADEQFKKKGRTFREVTEPDHPTRLKANEQYLKIKRLIGQTEGEDPGAKQQLIIIIGEKGLGEII